MQANLLGPYRGAPLLATAAAACWVALILAADRLDGTTLALGCLAASGLLLLALWPREPLPGGLRCRFCGKGQSEVYRLVAGTGDVCICDECIRVSDGIVHGELGRASDRVVLLLQSMLSKQLPAAEAKRLVDAWLAVGPTVEGSLSAASFARSGGNHRAAEHALAAIPEEHRGAAHRLELASLRIVELEDIGAIDAVADLPEGELGDDERVELRVLRAYAAYHLGPAAERESWLAEARAALAGLAGDGWAASKARALGAAMEVAAAQATGENGAAHSLAEEACERHRSALLFEMLGDLRSAIGDDAGAHEARARACELCDPETPRGKRLRAKAGAPYR